MTTVAIRRACEADAPAISALLYAAAERFFREEFSVEGLAHFRADFSADKVHARLCSDEFRYWVAEIADEQTGGKMTSSAPNIAPVRQLIGVCAVRGLSHLYNLFTHHDHLQRGVATALWRQACAQMRADGVQQVTVNASSYALVAYQRFGFQAIAPLQNVGGVVFTPMRCLLSACDTGVSA